jgi:hypothetical protein
MFISGYLTEEDFRRVVIGWEGKEFKMSCSSCEEYVFPVQFKRGEIKIVEVNADDIPLSEETISGKRRTRQAFIRCSLADNFREDHSEGLSDSRGFLSV